MAELMASSRGECGGKRDRVLLCTQPQLPTLQRNFRPQAARLTEQSFRRRTRIELVLEGTGMGGGSLNNQCYLDR